MTSRRTQKAAQAIRQVVSMSILTELKDPRVRDVTVTHVEVAPDMRQAKVHVSIMGDEKKQRLVLDGLTNSAGFLQAKIAERIDTRYTPRLQFVLDMGVKRSIEVARTLHEVLPGTPSADEAETDDALDADVLEADVLEADEDDEGGAAAVEDGADEDDRRSGRS